MRCGAMNVRINRSPLRLDPLSLPLSFRSRIPYGMLVTVLVWILLILFGFVVIGAVSSLWRGKHISKGDLAGKWSELTRPWQSHSPNVSEEDISVSEHVDRSRRRRRREHMSEPDNGGDDRSLRADLSSLGRRPDPFRSQQSDPRDDTRPSAFSVFQRKGRRGRPFPVVPPPRSQSPEGGTLSDGTPSGRSSEKASFFFDGWKRRGRTTDVSNKKLVSLHAENRHRWSKGFGSDDEFVDAREDAEREQEEEEEEKDHEERTHPRSPSRGGSGRDSRGSHESRSSPSRIAIHLNDEPLEKLSGHRQGSRDALDTRIRSSSDTLERGRVRNRASRTSSVQEGGAPFLFHESEELDPILHTTTDEDEEDRGRRVWTDRTEELLREICEETGLDPTQSGAMYNKLHEFLQETGRSRGADP